MILVSLLKLVSVDATSCSKRSGISLNLFVIGPKMQMQWTSWATIAALAVYVWTAVNVSRARSRYGVKAPAVDGPPEFLRAMRVQLNTVEQIILFLPCLWLCALWFGDHVAAIGGAVWVVGRIWYALAYYRDASRRAKGFVLTITASLSLLLLAVIGLLR